MAKMLGRSPNTTMDLSYLVSIALFEFKYLKIPKHKLTCVCISLCFIVIPHDLIACGNMRTHAVNVGVLYMPHLW